VFALIRADQLMTPFANTVRAEAVTNQLILEFEWVALEAFICRGLMKLPQRRRLLVLVVVVLLVRLLEVLVLRRLLLLLLLLVRVHRLHPRGTPLLRVCRTPPVGR
jgi:hypothetical protein